jgi:hypothetical protein
VVAASGWPHRARAAAWACARDRRFEAPRPAAPHLEQARRGLGGAYADDVDASLIGRFVRVAPHEGVVLHADATTVDVMVSAGVVRRVARARALDPPQAAREYSAGHCRWSALMRLTTKGRYAVTAMLDLALHAAEGPVCLGDIARRQELSLSYLEQLFARLRRKGLVSSVRGPGGGYRLRSPPDQLRGGRRVPRVRLRRPDVAERMRRSRRGDGRRDVRRDVHPGDRRLRTARILRRVRWCARDLSTAYVGLHLQLGTIVWLRRRSLRERL